MKYKKLNNERSHKATIITTCTKKKKEKVISYSCSTYEINKLINFG